MKTPKEETLFIVSGYMRTGTSMMMRALEAGGLEASYKQSRDEMKDRFKDEFYDPNLGGLYELEPNDYRDPSFPRKFKGKLIKCLLGGIQFMKVMPKIKVVMMKRDTEEIRQSYMAFFNKEIRNLDNLANLYQNVIETLNNRRDTDLVVFEYREVLKDPLKHFKILREQYGWPIDPVKCAKMVDPSLCRYKLEELEVGVL